jgi:hypothetical protein
MSARKKTQKPIAPASPISLDAGLRDFERITREGIARIKEDDLERGQQYSAMVNVGVELIDPRLIKEKKFDHPRLPGAVDDLGKLLIEIVTRHRGISNDEVWEELRALADHDHLVVQEVDDEEISYQSRGKQRKPLGRRGFAARMTHIRKLLK